MKNLVQLLNKVKALPRFAKATLIGFTFLLCVAAVAPVPDIIVKGGTWYDVRIHADLASALTAIGAANKTVLVLRTETIATNLTPAANVDFWVLGGGGFSINTGRTLDLSNTTVRADTTRQVFSGLGSLVPPRNALKLEHFGTVTLADSMLGSQNTHLTVEKLWTISASESLGATKSLEVVGAGGFTVASGQTLTLSGPFRAMTGKQVFYSDGRVRLSGKQLLDARWWPSFSKAVEDIGTDSRTLEVFEPMQVSDTISVPSSGTALRLVVHKGGSIEPAAATTTTITVCPEAGFDVIFGGSGTVALTGCTEVKSEWFGSTIASVPLALASITRGTVLMTQKSYTGDLTLENSYTTPKEVIGNKAIISGSLILNSIREFKISDLEVNTRMEVNGAYYSTFKDIWVKPANTVFGQSGPLSDRPLIITSRSGVAGAVAGTLWNLFENIHSYGVILAPGGKGDSLGVNKNTFLNCKFSYAETNGAADYTDTKGAGIHMALFNGSANCQANEFIGCDLAENEAYTILNETNDPVVIESAYIETDSSIDPDPVLYSGNVRFRDTYAAQNNFSSFPLDLNSVRSMVNRTKSGNTFLADSELYGNPYLNQLEWNAVANAWVPRGITAGTNDLATLEVVNDVTSGNPSQVVLKATATGAAKTVRFYGKRPSISGSKMSGAAVIKGNFLDIRMQTVGATMEDCFIGEQSATEYAVFSGFCGAADTTVASWLEVNLNDGDEIYIAMISISQGNVTTLGPAHRPMRVEATSTNGKPTSGFWPQDAIVYNTATGTTSQNGTPFAWMVTDPSAPTWKCIGQRGYQSYGGRAIGNLTPRDWADGCVELAYNSDAGVWYVSTGATINDWQQATFKITNYAGNPNSAVTPTAYVAGQIEMVFDTTNKDWYIATGATNTDWTKFADKTP